MPKNSDSESSGKPFAPDFLTPPKPGLVGAVQDLLAKTGDENPANYEASCFATYNADRNPKITLLHSPSGEKAHFVVNMNG